MPMYESASAAAAAPWLMASWMLSGKSAAARHEDPLGKAWGLDSSRGCGNPQGPGLPRTSPTVFPFPDRGRPPVPARPCRFPLRSARPSACPRSSPGAFPRREDFPGPAPEIPHFLLFNYVSDEFLVAFTGRPDIYVENITPGFGEKVPEHPGLFGRVHAADLRAIRMALGPVPGAHALDEADRLRGRFAARLPSRSSVAPRIPGKSGRRDKSRSRTHRSGEQSNRPKPVASDHCTGINLLSLRVRGGTRSPSPALGRDHSCPRADFDIRARFYLGLSSSAGPLRGPPSPGKLPCSVLSNPPSIVFLFNQDHLQPRPAAFTAASMPAGPPPITSTVSAAFHFSS